MIYPESHPKFAKISELKKEIDGRFSAIKNVEDLSRVDFGQAMSALKTMGEHMQDRDQNLKELTRLMKELEDVITSPLI